MLRTKGQIVFLNFLVYGLGEEGISPRLGDEAWFYVRNPLVECIGADEVVDLVRREIASKHGVQITIEI